MREIEDGFQIADRSGDDLALRLARMTLGFARVQRHKDAECDRGCKVLAEISELLPRQGHILADLPGVEAYLARGGLGAEIVMAPLPLLRATAPPFLRRNQLN
jgi:hypothetical protein